MFHRKRAKPTQLNTVEVNFTFRQLLKETTAQKWIAESPAGFRFGIKAHQVSGRYDNEALRELLSRDIEFDMASIERAPELEGASPRRLRAAQVNGPSSR